MNISKLYSISAITLTFYASPKEIDFGTKATQEIRYTVPGDSVVHKSFFVNGFASRFSTDPVNPNLAGVCMEGAGAISIDLHKNDPQLTALYQSGLTTLVLENYDENSDTCTFQLAKSPVSATGDNLVIGRSAAVKAGNTLFPMNRWVKIYRNRKFFSLRQIDDTCSSCESDNHIDIYVDSKVRDLPAGKYSAELMPAGFYLH